MHINELETPALLVDLAVVQANIERMADYCTQHGIDLRVHVTSHKSPVIAYKQVGAGACGIACEKLSEAEAFADAGFCDIFIHGNIVGREKLNHLGQLIEGVSVRVAVDSWTIAAGISQVAKQVGKQISILIKVELGDKIPHETVSLGKQLIDLPNVDLVGLMTFPSSPSDRLPLLATLRHFETAGISIPVVSGRTRNAFQTHEIPEITELCAGPYVFFDLSHVDGGVCGIENCALTVLTTVVSAPNAGRPILDAGAKTLTMTSQTSPHPKGAGKEVKKFGVIKHCPDAFLDRLSEERAHLNTRRFKVGEKVRVIPVNSHATIRVNDTFALVRGDRVLEVLPFVARGKMQKEFCRASGNSRSPLKPVSIVIGQS